MAFLPSALQLCGSVFVSVATGQRVLGDESQREAEAETTETESLMAQIDQQNWQKNCLEQDRTITESPNADRMHLALDPIVPLKHPEICSTGRKVGRSK